MELRHRGLARLRRASLLALALLLLLPATAAAVDPQLPASQTEPPRFFDRSARQAERIAARASKVREARRDALDLPRGAVEEARWLGLRGRELRVRSRGRGGDQQDEG